MKLCALSRSRAGGESADGAGPDGAFSVQVGQELGTDDAAVCHVNREADAGERDETM